MIATTFLSSFTIAKRAIIVTVNFDARDHFFSDWQDAYLFGYICDLAQVYEQLKELAWLTPYDVERLMNCEDQSKAVMVAQQLKIKIRLNCIDKSLLEISRGYLLLTEFINQYNY